MIVLSTWAFWALYVLSMGLYRAHLQRRLSWSGYVLGAPFLITGILVDVVANLTLASLLFLDPPREVLVTARLRRYVAPQHGWRCVFATWVCDNLLDVFDPSGNHC